RDRPDRASGRRHRGPDHHPGRRRALHGAHHPRGHGRAGRLRAAALGAAGGAGRPRPARAAHPARLRGHPGADDRVGVGAGHVERAWRAGPGGATRASFMSLFRHRHLLGTESLTAEDLTMLLDLGERFLEIAQRPIKKVPTLRGKTVINLFLEPSTRTRTSFEIAAKRLSADAINISGAASSTVKGETLLDTARNLDAMAPDVVVLRHAQAGAAEMLAGRIAARVVNAGDGAHEHPTQALLDCSTIRAHKGKLAGLTVAICGDITHSRVARSNIFALTALGAQVRVAGPRTLLPPGLPQMVEGLGAPLGVHDRIEPAIE